MSKRESKFYMASAMFPQIINKMVQEHKVNSLLVLSALEDCSDDNGACVISQKDISIGINRSTATVQNAIQYLRTNHYIKEYFADGNNFYIINPYILWHVTRDEKERLCYQLDFPSITKLTHNYDNEKYFKLHKIITNGNKMSKHYKQYVHGIINHDDKITEKIVGTPTNRSIALALIKQRIRPSNYTHREMEVVNYLLDKIPVKAGHDLPMRNIDIKTSMNNSVTIFHPIGYSTVAKATFNLRKDGVIIRHHKSIRFAPDLLPLDKTVLHIKSKHKKRNK